MATKWLTAIVAMLILAGNVPLGHGADLTAEVKAMRVVPDDFPLEAFDFPPMNVQQTGMTLLVLISSVDKSIIAIDAHASKITSLSDDKGTDLLRAKPKAKTAESRMVFGKPSVIGFPMVSKDGKLAALEINAPRSPAKGSTRLTVKGSMTVNVATGKKKLLANNTAIAPGKVALEGQQITIKQAKTEKNWQGQQVFKVQVELRGQSAQMFAGLRFLDARGKDLGAMRRSTMSMGTIKQIDYELKAPVKSATLELSLWQGLETVIVPLEAKFGIGL